MLRLYRSVGFAISGIKAGFRSEANFKIHVILAACAFLLGCCFQISFFEWMAVFICTGMVTAFELMNTSIEKLCNIISKEKHMGIKAVKDLSAGAVLVSAVAAGICGAIIFIPKIISMLNQ